MDLEISAKVASSSLLPRTCISPEVQGRPRGKVITFWEERNCPQPGRANVFFLFFLSVDVVVGVDVVGCWLLLNDKGRGENTKEGRMWQM